MSDDHRLNEISRRAMAMASPGPGGPVLPVSYYVTEVAQLADQLAAADQRAEALKVAYLQDATNLLAELERTRQLALEIVGRFTHPGHPGEPCRRSGWIPERVIAQWHAELTPPAGDTSPHNAPQKYTEDDLYVTVLEDGAQQ